MSNMSLSLSPLEIVRFFRERGVQERSKVVQFVREVADEASKLASLWSDLVKEYPHTGDDLQKAEAFRMTFDDMQQNAAVQSLRGKYQMASTVIRDVLSDAQRKEFFDALGGLLGTRRLLRSDQFGVLLPSVNSPAELRSVVSELHQDAAKLRVLASELAAL
jgi:hypothetical protein